MPLQPVYPCTCHLHILVCVDTKKCLMLADCFTLIAARLAVASYISSLQSSKALKGSLQQLLPGFVTTIISPAENVSDWSLKDCRLEISAIQLHCNVSNVSNSSFDFTY